MALGATRWEKIRMTCFPYAKSGIIAGSMLALGRALGEFPEVARDEGRSWINAAKAGDVPGMEALLGANAHLLRYRGEGTSFGFTGHSALHWAAAKGRFKVLVPPSERVAMGLTQKQAVAA